MLKKIYLTICLFASMTNPLFASNVNYYQEPLDISTELLLGEDWNVGYTKNSYRELVVNFSEERQIPTKWADVLDETGKRHGIAFLIDMEKHEILVTPIDSFRTPGIHYVQSRILQQEQRYSWDKWQKAAREEQIEHLVAVERAERMNKERERAKVRFEYEQKYKERVAVVDKEKKDYFKTVDVKLADLEKQENANALVRANLEQDKSQVRAQRKQLAEQIQQQEEKTKSIARLEKEKQDMIAKESATQQLVAKYYPDVDRVLPAGDSKAQIDEFLNKYWGYHLSWSDDLINLKPTESISLSYPIYFKGADLARDVSKIVCSLTRDVPGITIFSEIDPESRLVTMQMHKGSFAVRKQLLAQCFN